VIIHRHTGRFSIHYIVVFPKKRGMIFVGELAFHDLTGSLCTETHVQPYTILLSAAGIPVKKRYEQMLINLFFDVFYKPNKK
jgi:hypothetical protein